MIVNNPAGDNLEIVATKSVAVFEWNKETVLTWARQYAEKYVGLMVTEENLPDMEAANKELSSKIKRLEEFRKTNKAQMEAPIKQFESEVKEVVAVIESVKTPIAEQVRKFEDQRRCEQASLVSSWIDEICAAVGLRPEYAKQISVAESWTNRTAVKSKVKAEIEAKATALMAMQSAADQAEELKRQKNEMAVMMCKLQSESAGLAKPIEPKDIYGIANLSLMDLPAAITAAVTKQRDAEQAAIERAERQRVEAAEREARQKADDYEAEQRRKAQDEAAAAIAAVEAGKVYTPKEKQFRLDVSVFGTEFECQQFLAIIEANGYKYTLGKMEEV